MFKAMAESWGARPTPMNFNGLYLALKRGVVDGQEKSATHHQERQVLRSAEIPGALRHIMTPRLVVVNDAAWQKIAAADRKAVEDVLKAQMAWADSQIIAQEKTLVDEFKAAGVTVLQPDVAEWRKATLAAVPPKFERSGQGHLRVHRQHEMTALRWARGARTPPPSHSSC